MRNEELIAKAKKICNEKWEMVEWAKEGNFEQEKIEWLRAEWCGAVNAFAKLFDKPSTDFMLKI